MAPNKKALGANSGGLFTREIWRARRDSNPRPPDPKSGSRQSQQLESIRAWNDHRKDAVFVDSGVSLDPAPERVLIPSREPGRVRCPRRHRHPSNAHDETQDYTPRLWGLRHPTVSRRRARNDRAATIRSEVQ